MGNNNQHDWHEKTILLVEDEALGRLFFQSVLRHTHAHLLLAKNGKEAIEMVERHSEIDLVLMDIQLPVMDGLEATKEIRKIRPELHIIAQTAYTLDNDRQKAMKAGCNDYLAKPIEVELMFEKIEKVFMTN